LGQPLRLTPKTSSFEPQHLRAFASPGAYVLRVVVTRFERDIEILFRTFRRMTCRYSQHVRSTSFFQLVQRVQRCYRRSVFGRFLPPIGKMPKKGGFSRDYLDSYASLSDATHSGLRELEIYLEFDAEQKAATNFRYGPNDGPWIPWCTLIATRALARLR
jgi:hypothetical protein